MATYSKRGYKTPKVKEDNVDNDFIEDVIVDEKDSTTAGVFNTLDETASKTEEWVAKNQKVIFECLFPQKNLSIIKNSVSISRNANAC